MATTSCIVVVGSCMIDLISYAPRLPKPGETLLGSKFVIGFGGKGANQSVAAARLGASVAVIAKVGEDYFGKDYIQNFEKNNINIDYVSCTNKASTGVAPITVDETGQNSIIIISGANLLLSPDDILKATDLIQQAKVIVGGFETNLDATLEAFKIAKQCNVTSILNAAPGVEEINPLFFMLSSIFCVNETEAELITKMPVKSVIDAQNACLRLIELGCQIAIITLGENGAVFVSSDNPVCEHVRSKKVKAVDCTGAGDSFIGALAYYMGYYCQLSLKEKIQRSCDIATYSVQLPGTQTSYLKKEELPVNLFGI